MHGMTYIGRFFSNFKDFYNDINAATLTGAIDVVVVEQPDGTYNCSPFHVRFGKLGVLRSREKIVDIEINGEQQDIHMKLGESGEAFFVEEIEGTEETEIPEHLATSPIPVSEFEKLYTAQGRRRNSFDLGENIAKPVLENQVNDYKKRRYTADDETDKHRERDFLKRQIILGNIDIGENSTEDLSLSLQSTTKFSSEDVSKDNDISETIFSLELETNSKADETAAPQNSKVEVDLLKTPVKSEDVPGGEGKSSKKKRRKKSMMKKKNAQRKSATNSVTDFVSCDVSDQNEPKTNDSATDRSSLDSNISEPELKEMQKIDIDPAGLSGSNPRKKAIDPDFHFFSDTELTSANVDSRPSSPIHVESVQSDTEFEVKNRKDDVEEDKGQRWAWGEFPSVSQTNSPTSETAGPGGIHEQEHNSMLTSMFSFMKQNKHRRHNSNDGVYLADISSGAIDPEVAALYFSNSAKKKNNADADMDCESGNGPSLAQSPNSVEGSKSIDSDFEEHNKSNQSYVHDISLSLCGWNPEPTEDNFIRHVVAFSDLCNNPSLLESPNLVVRIRNKYYNWKVAIPMITSFMIYQRALPQSTIDQLCSLHMPTTNIQDKETKQESRSYWWYWRRNRTSRETTPALDNSNVTGACAKIAENIIADTTTTIDLEESVDDKSVDGNLHAVREYTTLEMERQETLVEGVEERSGSPAKLSNSDKYRKTLRLSSKQIASLNLRDGMNEVEFSVTTAYQGTTRCKCHLYKWKWDDKIVISDIDGTITKSDVLGHILPIVGKDWAQSGVAQLFNKIKDNGYKLLYLSARAIGQARITREYLKSIKQGDLSMPDGPLLLNPTSLITAFHREVIEKKPEQFKISCMSDIRALFPADSNPFYAGYGNRINDVWAYTAVGIPIVRIFTINPKGELKHELTQTFQSSYSNMSYIVDQLFPPLLEAANDYSQFIYWRQPVPVFEDLPDID